MAFMIGLVVFVTVCYLIAPAFKQEHIESKECLIHEWTKSESKDYLFCKNCKRKAGEL